MVSDPIADGLTKIRNASRAKHPTVDLRASKFLERILEVLKREGFIRAYKAVGEEPATRTLRVYLKYVPPAAPGGRAKRIPGINQIVRISKPGMRVYRNAKGLPRVLGGLGTAVVSTSKGLLTEQEAYRQRIGGEIICHVW